MGEVHQDLGGQLVALFDEPHVHLLGVLEFSDLGGA
jgi:hypothetical protein